MASPWSKYVKEKSSQVENKFLGERFHDRLLLIRALTRNAKLNEEIEFPELKANGSQVGFDTIGDTILDFTIIDHFSQGSKKFERIRCSPEQLNDLREFYGNNLILHKFAKNSLKLQDYIIWGSDEKARKTWNDQRTDLLADCFEALLGAIYLDKGIKGVMKFMQKNQFFQNIDKISRR
ncbi:MAG: ribonuclease III domain-containing protein [Methanomicrobiales archaeon]|nr:ribonuclease III domain-containing protein [Methanomicrobiales archaeon]